MPESSRPLRRSAELVALVGILMTGMTLRFVGLDWDDSQHLHPDERFLTMVASSLEAPGTPAEYFSTDTSPLNPGNAGYPFFVYGTLPLFLVRALAGLFGMADYTTLHLVGRVVSALFDSATILVTWWLGRILVGPRVGVVAAALMALSVVSIQNAHFFTVDSTGAFFTLAALVGLVWIAGGRGWLAHIGFGIAFAAAIACRINLAILGPFYVLATARAVWTRRRGVSETLGFLAVTGCVIAVLFRIMQPYAFAGPGFFDVTPASGFMNSMTQVRDMVTGAIHFPPANQWIGRTPVVFPASNLFVWGLGPAWGIAGLVGIVWCLARRRPEESAARESWALGRLVALWAALTFLYHGSQFVTTLRYFLPIVPVLAIAAGWFLTQSGRWFRGALIVVAVASAVWAIAFTAIYRAAHTRVEASRWVYDNVPEGSVLAGEEWDDVLPLPFDSPDRKSYESLTLPVYEEDTEQKRESLIAALEASDYLVISSRRAYSSIPRSPWRYPLTRRYYELLFAGKLGFRLERAFTSYPGIGPLSIDDDAAEEQFTVYDHPKVLVFAKAPEFSESRVRSLFEAVPLDGTIRVAPAEASRLYRQSWPSEIATPDDAEAGSPPRSPRSLQAALELVGLWELNALAVFAILFPVLGAAQDRGFALSKLVAWLAPGYLVFVLCALGIAPHARTTLGAVTLFLWVAGAVAAWRHRAAIASFVRCNARELLVVQGVLWLGFTLFAILRALNPSVFWGEKPMDFAILNAIYRSPSLPPVDPWFAGEFLNYNYFGHLLVAYFGRLTGMPPDFAFNLGIAVVGALLAVCAYAVGRQLVGVRTGVVAALSATVLGSLAGVRLALLEPGRPFDFNFFWETSRVIEGTINEFPFWSLLFGDLHAHVLALPFDMALLYVGTLWLIPARPETSSSTLLMAVLAAWFGGASVATSQWNLPVTIAVPVVFLLASSLGMPKGRRSVIRIVSGTLVVTLLGRILFLPFWSRYQPPSFVGIGWESATASFVDVFTVFGPFLLIVWPVLCIKARALVSRREAVIGGVVVVSVLVAIFVFRSGGASVFLATVALGALVGIRTDVARDRLAALLVALAGSIGVLTELVYISERMNTVFKYYLHMWLLLAVASAVLVSSGLGRSSVGRRRLWQIAIATIVAGSMFTSIAAGVSLLRHPIEPPAYATLDGVRYLTRDRPGEWEAFRWMRREITGVPVVLESQGPSYELYSRVSMNTGLPTVLGWANHLVQQNRDPVDVEARREHVRTMYETTDYERAASLMDRFSVDFVVIGPLERETYGAEGLAKFEHWSYTEEVFDSQGVAIYARPGAVASTKTWVSPARP